MNDVTHKETKTQGYSIHWVFKKLAGPKYLPFDLLRSNKSWKKTKQQKIKATKAQKTKRRGRPKGSSQYNDAPLLEKMKEMLSSGAAKSLHAAAQKVASDTFSYIEHNSTVRRLMRKYNDKYKKV